MNYIAILNDSDESYKSKVMLSIADELNSIGFNTDVYDDEQDMISSIENNARLCGVIFDWDRHDLALCQKISQINSRVPNFVFVSKNHGFEIKLSQLTINLRFHEYLIAHIPDIVIKMQQAIDEYRETILPPFTKALFSYVGKEKYTFCTPGHMGGTAFERSPAGALFYDFYGENTMRSDISVSMDELGSLLDHSGPHREAENYIASVFNADRSYIITNGTSTANKVVGMYSCHAGGTVLVDRNCHKSITHLMMMSDITPVYLKPTRNAYGILGGIPKSEFSHEHIEALLKAQGIGQWPCHAIITNSTYDGLFYNTQFIKQTLPVKSIHFDSAWVPYTQFHPVYQNKSGMGGEPVSGKLIFETQSTHKLLAAFSQASMIHVKGDFNESTFNEAYMMHTSTSPLYSIVASCEISAAMMKGAAGVRLMEKTIDLAISFRKEIVRLGNESEDWFFDVWQPDNIDEVCCWPLNSVNNWHGFKNIDDDHMSLDPIKITLLTPGLDRHGNLADVGIPASVVAGFLSEYGIIVEKTGPYSLLFLFSLGVDKTKSLTLLKALSEFKYFYDKNALVHEVLPELFSKDPVFYKNMRIQALAHGIHKLIVKHRLPELMYEAFETLPQMAMTPHRAFQQEILGNTCECLLSEMTDKISANMILPYPPGVPLIMPGEKLTGQNRPVLSFLEMLCEIGSHYPGFETDIHGVYRNDQGEYMVKVLTQP